MSVERKTVSVKNNELSKADLHSSANRANTWQNIATVLETCTLRTRELQKIASFKPLAPEHVFLLLCAASLSKQVLSKKFNLTEV